MWSSDRQHRLFAATPRILRAGAVVLALALPGAGRLAAAPPPAPSAAAQQSLRAAIEKKYEVLPVQRGVVLKPRTEGLGVRTVEVSGGTIAVNGEGVSEGVLRAWLGAEAEPILSLQKLSPDERLALFGLRHPTSGEQTIPDTAESPAAPAPPTPPASPSPAATPALTESPAEAETAETPETPDTPEAPERPSGSSGSLVKLFGGITVDKGELAEQAVAILGSVRVDGEVAQDVVAVGGSVVVDGKVGGNVTAVGGSVHLGPHSEVMGEVTSVGGGVHREEGAKVRGTTSDVGVTGDHDWNFGPRSHRWHFFGDSFEVLWRLISMAVLALLVFLCLLLARRHVERAEYFVATEPWKAAGVGFLAQLLFIPLLVVVTILLAITIIGCALYLLYPFLLIGVVIACLIGFTAVAHQVGRHLESRFDRRFGSVYGVALIGVVTIEILSIAGHVIGLGGGFLHLLALFVLIGGLAVRYAAWTVGMGAMILARFNPVPPGWSTREPAPLVPPAAPVTTPPADTGTAAGGELPLSESREEPGEHGRDDREEYQ